MASQKASHFVTNKLLGIDVNERQAQIPQDLDTRAEKVLSPADIYLESEPTVGEFFSELAPTKDGALQYIHTLFPSAGWITRYCFSWLLGDVIAGITIGLVVVPQAMAYALLANLTPPYGLYTSFTGAVLYWIFGTSKDIVIGTTAVGSLLVGQVITNVDAALPGKYSKEEIAHALSMMSGACMLFFGLLRLGWIIEFIPYIPISAFVTGASITIMSTQVPTVLGIRGINTHDAPYKVIIETLKKLPETKLDAAIGLVSIVLLFALRDICAFMERRNPQQKRVWQYVSSLRLTFVMLLFTLISFLVNRGLPEKEAKFRIVGFIETGFKRAHLPTPSPELIGKVMPELPAVVIILIVEHIAIAKAMGRQFNYTINSSQEIVALGAANLFSPFMGGYVCTGSFGASAVLSKAGVRTPLAGLFSALVLILALYALTAVFYYIPNAALAGLIIHAVCNLLTPPKNLYKYWQLSPLELGIWVVGVVLAIFESLETSIYAGICLSLALLLFRSARTKGRFLGHVRATRVVDKKAEGSMTRSSSHATLVDAENASRDVFMPLDRKDASNADVQVNSPSPGVFIYRFSEGYNYINQASHISNLVEYITAHTKRTSEEHFAKESDRLWNDPGARKQADNSHLPYLRAVVFDFATVNNVDVTCVQGLVDLRNTLDRYAAPDAVEWHFANVHNRWTRRALASAGFGYPSSKNPTALNCWIPTYSIAKTLEGGMDEASAQQSRDADDVEANGNMPSAIHSPNLSDSDQNTIHAGDDDSKSISTQGALRAAGGQKRAAISGVDRPFFHLDLVDAVDAAVRGAKNHGC